MYHVRIDESGIHYTRLNGQDVFKHQFLGKEVLKMQSLLKVKGFRVMAKIEQGEMADALGMARRTYLDRENNNKFTIDELKQIKCILADNGLVVTLEDLT